MNLFKRNSPKVFLNLHRSMFSVFLALFATAFVCPESLGLDITTSDGIIYHGCEIKKVEADGVRVSHRDGVAKIPFERLPAALQQQYGFDPKAAVKAAGSTKPGVSAEAGSDVSLSPRQPEAERPANEPLQGGPAKTVRSSLDDDAVLVASCCVVLFLLFALFHAGGRDKRGRKALGSGAQAFIEQTARSGGLQPVTTSLILSKGEVAYFAARAVLHEPKSVRNYVSGSMGFRIAKGVWIGGSRGTSRSTLERGRIDSGTLTITSNRIIFDGTLQDRTARIDKVLTVNPFLDGVEISVEGKQKSMFFEGPNPLIVAFVIECCARGRFTGGDGQS